MTLTLPISQKIPQVKLEVVADFNRTDYSGQTAEAVGWGFTEPYLIDEDNPSRIISNQLNKVDLTIMSATECNEKFRLQFPNNVRDNTEGGTLICASGALKKGVCEVILIDDRYSLRFVWLIIGILFSMTMEVLCSLMAYRLELLIFQSDVETSKIAHIILN